MKRLEAVRRAEAMNLIRMPASCSNQDNMVSSLAKECGDRMRFLNGVIGTDDREVFVNVAKLLLKEEINVMTMIDRWSSNYKHEIQALYSQEHELREKYKAYRAENNHRMLEFFSNFQMHSTTDINASCSMEPLRTIEQLLSAKKATLDLQSLVTAEAAIQALQKGPIGQCVRWAVSERPPFRTSGMSFLSSIVPGFIFDISHSRKDVVSYKAEVAVLSCELREAKLSAVKSLECTICCHELDIANHTQALLRMRACFSPCFHASVCLECALRIWDDTKKMPHLQAHLSQAPSAIYF